MDCAHESIIYSFDLLGTTQTCEECNKKFIIEWIEEYDGVEEDGWFSLGEEVSD